MTARFSSIPGRISIVATAWCVGACTGEAKPSTSSTPLLSSIEQAVRWKESITLEENDHVINVSPGVVPDVGGAFLVSDALEQQVRIYGTDGRLRKTFGRRGSGPGEFQHLTSAVRLPDATVLAADMGGQLTRFDSAGTSVLSTAATGLGPIYRVVPMDDSMVVIVGRKGGALETPLVHVWSLRSNRLMRSLYPAPQGPNGFAASYAFTGFADVAVRGDTMAALFALSDTVHLFTRDGREVGKIPVPYRGFRRMTAPMPQQVAPEPLQKWLASFSASTNLFWLTDGTFLVQYLDQKESDRSFGLLRMDRNGRGLWEVSGSPRLLGVRPDGGLVFVSPGSETPNRWSLADLAPAR